MLLMAPKTAGPSLLERRQFFRNAALKLEAVATQGSEALAEFDKCSSAYCQAVQTVLRSASPHPSPKPKDFVANVLLRRGRPAALQLDCRGATTEANNRSGRTDIPWGSLEKYSLLESLGQGSTGVVYDAKHRESGRRVALKVMRMHDEELLETARKEYELLRGINHPRIIQAFDFFQNAQGAVLVMEHFPGSTLLSTIHKLPERRLDEACAKRLFLALCQAVQHLHQQGIIHRDVKAENILVSTDLQDLKLVDFNTAQRVLDGALTMTGTADYLPPEVLLGDSLREESDVWAMGICLRLMLTGSLPLKRKLFTSHENFGNALLKCACCTDVEARGVSVACLEVLEKCLAADPKQRSTSEALLKCAWFMDEAN